jgi:ABC-type Zn uptake system ZnuABC Zn-binding protein ZnuA
VAEYVENEYKAKTVIVDSDHANSPTKVKKLIDQIKEKQPQIVI